MAEFTESCLKTMQQDEDMVYGDIDLYDPDIFDNLFEKNDRKKSGVIKKEEMRSFLKEVAAESMANAEMIKK